MRKVWVFICFVLLSIQSTYAVEQKSASFFEKSGYVLSEGAELYYKQIGSGDPVIAIHGGPGLDHCYLMPQMRALANTHQLILYDQRGAGKSLIEPSEETISLDLFIKDLENIRKALGLQKVSLLGHSWGGIIAMQYAIRFPENVSSLILLSSMPSTSDGVALFLEEYGKRTKNIAQELEDIKNTEAFSKGDPETVSRYFRLIFSTYCHNPHDAEQLTFCFTPKGALSGFQVNEIFEKTFWSTKYDFTKELEKLDIPSCILHGDKDVTPLVCAEKTASTIPHAQLIILKECGHFPYIEQKAACFEAIEAFFQKNAPLPE